MLKVGDEGPSMTESFLHLLRSSAKRAFGKARSLFGGTSGSDPYLRWLDNEMKTRIADYPLEGTPVRFSILTAVYEKTHAGYFDKTARSVLRQTYSDFEWIVLAHGPVTSEIMSRLENLSKDPRVRLVFLEQNVGIIGGMKHCLAAAAGDYVVPLDADDLMTDDALRTFARVIQKRGDPEFLTRMKIISSVRSPKPRIFGQTGIRFSIFRAHSLAFDGFSQRPGALPGDLRGFEEQLVSRLG
jgi:hypothetical protein